MPRPSKVDLLPPQIREKLDRKLKESSFSGYEDLSKWLLEQGFEIGKSSVQRYGYKLKVRMEAIAALEKHAKAIVATCPDDENAIAEALSRLAQERAFEALIDLEDPGNMDLAKLCRAIADLNRSSISIKKYKSEVKAAKKQAIKTLTQEGKGLSKESLELIKQEIAGIPE